MDWTPLFVSFRQRWFGPALLTLGLLLALLTLFSLMEHRDRRLRQDQLVSHATITARSLQQKLTTDSEFLQILADGMSRGMLNVSRFQEQVRSFVAANPEVLRVSWRDQDFTVRWAAPAAVSPLDPLLAKLAEPRRASQEATETGHVVFSHPFLTLDKHPAAVLLVPIVDGSRQLGLITAFYNLDLLLRHSLTAEVRQNYEVCLVDPAGNSAIVCTGVADSNPRRALQVPLQVHGTQYNLVFRPRSLAGAWGGRLLMVLVLVLSLGLGWGMWALQRDVLLRRRIQVDLQNHLNLLQTILASTPDAIYVKSPDGRYRLANRIASRLLGRRADEVVGATDEQLLPPAESKRVQQADQTVLAVGRPLTQEEQMESADGARCLLVTRTPFRDDRGEIAGLVGVARDITDRKAAERVLAESEQRFRTIFESAAIGAATLLPDGSFLQINRSLCDFVGRDEVQLRRLRLDEVVAPEEQAATHRLFSVSLPDGEGDEVVRQDRQFLRPDGQMVWGQLTATLVRQADGRPDYWVALVQDIDERMQALRALQQSEERYRLLFSASSDPILVFEAASGRIVETNLATQELLGYVSERLRSMTLNDLFDTGVAGGCRAPDLLAPHLRRVPVATLKDAAGHRIPTEIAAGRFAWQGRELGVAIVHDITEQQKLEHLKDEMLSSVSHEMRTPLTAMLGFTEFLLDNPVTAEQQREYLGILQNETNRLKDLIDNLLNLQRLRAGYGLLTIASVSIPALLHDMVTLFGPHTQRHQVVIDCDPELPSVEADEGQLYHALRNLVSNAIKYSPAGGTVTLGARPDNGGVRVWVRDEGIGVPEAAQERIFERFYRVAVDGEQRIGGTGLGLPLVKEIVEQHGGRVWLESVEGKGSAFFLFLPLHPPPRPEADEAAVATAILH